MTDFFNKSYKYNASNQISSTDYEFIGTGEYIHEQEWLSYSGDGQVGKIETASQYGETEPVNSETAYKIHSSVTLAHELLHAYGNEVFSHGQMALAALSAATDLGLNVGDLPRERDFIDPNTGKVNVGDLDEANGRYVSEALRIACKGGLQK